MNCYIFDVHINSCFLADTRLEDGILFYTHDLVQVGPLNMICSEVISAVKREARMISSFHVPVNWWIFYSTIFIFSLEDTYKGENNIKNYYLAFLGIGPSSVVP